METKLPFEVPATMVSGKNAMSGMMKLSFPDRDIAVFEPSRMVNLSWAIMVAAGVIDFIIAGGAAYFLHSLSKTAGHEALKYASIIIPAALAVGGVVAILIGTAGLKGKLSTRQILFDRRRGIAVKEARKVEPAFEDGLSLKNVAAVQLCYGKMMNSKGCEINLILNEPAGQRINLVSQLGKGALRNDAEQLAEFLKVPFIDSTEK
jgi:hypothetical protein